MDPEDDEDQGGEDGDDLVPGKQRVKVMFTPTYGEHCIATYHVLW